MATLKEYHNTGDNANSTWTEKHGQTFQAESSYDITSVKLKLSRIGGSPGSVTVEIYGVDGSNQPTGAALATSSVNVDSITTDSAGEEVEFAFSSAASLINGATYAIVLTDNSSLLRWRYQWTGNGYANGGSLTYDEGTWYGPNGVNDQWFECWEAATVAPAIRMIDFIYSKSIAYACEFRDQQIRFYYDNAVLQDGGNDVFISAPYAEGDLFELFYKQINDTMWIVHEDYQPRKLTRTSSTTFSLDAINFNRGPFLTRNDLIDLNPITIAEMSFEDGTLTCTGSVFESGHVGALFQLTHAVPDRIVEQDGTGISNTILAKGKVEFLTRGNWTGTVAFEKNANRAGWEKIGVYRSSVNARQNIRLTHTEEELNVLFRINASEASSDFRGEITPANYLQHGIVKITAVTDPNTALAETVANVVSSEYTKRWAEGAWSDKRTWPSAITFHKGRCVYSGKRIIPSQILTDAEGPE